MKVPGLFGGTRDESFVEVVGADGAGPGQQPGHGARQWAGRCAGSRPDPGQVGPRPALAGGNPGAFEPSGRPAQPQGATGLGRGFRTGRHRGRSHDLAARIQGCRPRQRSPGDSHHQQHGGGRSLPRPAVASRWGRWQERARVHAAARSARLGRRCTGVHASTGAGTAGGTRTSRGTGRRHACSRARTSGERGGQWQLWSGPAWPDLVDDRAQRGARRGCAPGHAGIQAGQSRRFLPRQHQCAEER